MAEPASSARTSCASGSPARRRDHGPRQAHLRRAAGEPRGPRRAARRRRHRGRGGGRRRARGLRRDRQLRRRDARRPLDRRARRVRHHPRARHLHAARGRPRALAALRAGLHRRGLRLDRGGLVHRGVAAAAVVAVLGHEGGRRPAGRLLPPHVRPRGADLPRLEQLRAVPVPGEADPADGAQRAARRQAAGLRRRDAGAQLDLRRGLRARHRHGARARRARARSTTSAARTRRRTSRWSRRSSSTRAPTTR